MIKNMWGFDLYLPKGHNGFCLIDQINLNLLRALWDVTPCIFLPRYIELGENAPSILRVENCGLMVPIVPSKHDIILTHKAKGKVVNMYSCIFT